VLECLVADLINVFEVFLPQLLLYPNPTDPLNGEAAALLMREPEAYNAKVRDYVEKYAKPDTSRKVKEDDDSDDDSASDAAWSDDDDASQMSEEKENGK